MGEKQWEGIREQGGGEKRGPGGEGVESGGEYTKTSITLSPSDLPCLLSCTIIH